jgi:hypothetical protein
VKKIIFRNKKGEKLKKINICGFEELINHGVEMGFDYNETHEMLRKADLFVGYICTDHYSDSAYCKANEHIEARKILKSFMKKNEVYEFYITPKNHDCNY